LKALAYSIQKSGSTPEEYEDAFALDPVRRRFAVADGASESAFAREWAELLVQANQPSPVGWSETWQSWLPPIQEEWLQRVTQAPLPWHAMNKVQEGAFSTFLSLMISTPNRGRWWSTAIGDTCVFHLREGTLISSFPICCSSEFGVQPDLIGSRMNPLAVPSRFEKWRTGTYVRGDVFFLATDAIAEWLLRQHECGRRPWNSLRSTLVHNPKAFPEWVEGHRGAAGIRNDDVTLVIVET